MSDEINWDKIEAWMHTAVSGRGALSDTAQTELHRAMEADRARYLALHAQVKQQEVAWMMGHRCDDGD